MSTDNDKRVVDQREKSEQIQRQYSRVFKTDDGQAVLKDLQEICFIEQSTYVAGCTDAMLINEGCRRVFLRIMKMTRMDTAKMYLDRDMSLKKPKLKLEG